ncbi:cytochrome P450 [Mycena vitilis]|nr:cytochrome P450 [Mycena vitilis]
MGPQRRSMMSQLLFPLAGTAICYGLLYLTRSVYQALTYSLRNVRGPRNLSFIFGNFKEVQNDRQQTDKWRDEFGPTFRFKSLFSTNNLYTSDVKALTYHCQLVNLSDAGAREEGYEGRPRKRFAIVSFWVNQAFGTPQIRAVAEIFVALKRQSKYLRDIWASQLSQKNAAPTPIDVYPWIKRMTLDVIGEAGFNYQFTALTTTEDSNELSHAFNELTHRPNMKRNTLVLAVQARVPVPKHLQHLLRGQDVTVNAHDQMFSIARRIVSENQASRRAVHPRVYAPVTFLDRVALEDDALPLSNPYIDKTGEAHDTLHIPEGQVIHVPMWNVNTDPEIWGDDATEFKPQRWANVPGAASGIPSIWANLFTFFAGPRNCIGLKFALVEFKALLFTLTRAFEFEPAVPAGGIVPTSAGLQSPMVLAEPDKGTSLPLRLKIYEL